MVQVLVISLAEKNHERREEVTQKLEQIGVQFDFFDAIDGRDGLAEELSTFVDKAKTQKRLGGPMSVREIACALSHVFLYKHMIDNNIEHCVVLEDDPIIDNDFALMLEHGVLETSGRDFIMLNHLFARGVEGTETPLLSGDKTYQLIEMARSPKSAQGYYLNLTAAKYLYNEILPITWVSDWGVDLTKLNSAAIVPRIVRHPKENPSAIRNSRVKRRKNRFPYGLMSTLRYYWLKPRTKKIS